MLISLATFSDGEGDEPIDVEEGILKQLFYKVEQKAIPQSRFRKIRKIRYWSVFGAVFAIVWHTPYVDSSCFHRTFICN